MKGSEKGENMERLLQPNWRKLMIFIILLSTLSFISSLSNALNLKSLDSVASLIVHPLSIDPRTGIVSMLGGANPLLIGSLLTLNLVYDYFIACLLVWAFDKARNIKTRPQAEKENVSYVYSKDSIKNKLA
jgi:hypothetical protein